MQTIITVTDEIQWVREVHCADMPESISFVLLTGNEDAPTKIEAWNARNPRYDATPDYIKEYANAE